MSEKRKLINSNSFFINENIKIERIAPTIISLEPDTVRDKRVILYKIYNFAPPVTYHVSGSFLDML